MQWSRDSLLSTRSWTHVIGSLTFIPSPLQLDGFFLCPNPGRRGDPVNNTTFLSFRYLPATSCIFIPSHRTSLLLISIKQIRCLSYHVTSNPYPTFVTPWRSFDANNTWNDVPYISITQTSPLVAREEGLLVFQMYLPLPAYKLVS